MLYKLSVPLLFQLENGIPKLISDASILKDNILVGIFKKEGNLLFLTQEKGFYYMQDNTLTQWEIPSNDIILTKKIYSAKRLRNQDFVLGTISNGFYYMNMMVAYSIKLIKVLVWGTIRCCLSSKT